MRPTTQTPTPARSWRAAVSTFTIIPVGGPETIGPELAKRIAYWLPAVGCLLALPAGGIVLGVEAVDTVPRRLLAATLAIAALGLLTGGLHLDGLADTADGLGSRRPAGQALEVMRRSDTGPMGTAALVFIVLVQITALAAVTPAWLSAAALITAVVTSRVAVLLASGAPAARSEGFGALLTETTTRGARWLSCAALLAVVGAVGVAAGGLTLASRGLVAAASGLVVAAAVRWLACRRLGGMTGDVFGALIEISTAAVLLVAALSA